MKHSMFRRLTALLLALVMAAGMIPSALAAGTETENKPLGFQIVKDTDTDLEKAPTSHTLYSDRVGDPLHNVTLKVVPVNEGSRKEGDDYKIKLIKWTSSNEKIAKKEFVYTSPKFCTVTVAEKYVTGTVTITAVITTEEKVVDASTEGTPPAEPKYQERTYRVNYTVNVRRMLSLTPAECALVIGHETKGKVMLAVSSTEIDVDDTSAYTIQWTETNAKNTSLLKIDLPSFWRTDISPNAAGEAISFEEKTTAVVTVQSRAKPEDTYQAECQVSIGKQVEGLTLRPTEYTISPNPNDPWTGLEAVIDPLGSVFDFDDIVWQSDNTAVATVTPFGTGMNRLRGSVTGKAPGVANIKVSLPGYGDGTDTPSATCRVEVSGVTLPERIDMYVGERIEMSEQPGYGVYGSAKAEGLPSWSSSSGNIASVPQGNRLVASKAGTTTITLTMGGFTDSCVVTVKEDVADAIIASVNSGAELSFGGNILSQIQSRANSPGGLNGDTFSYLTGISVETEQGVVYYGYVSSDAHNYAVGATDQFYESGVGNKLISDLSFVAAPNFNDTAIINYTAIGRGGNSFKGTIRVSVSSTGDVRYTTGMDRPVAMVAEDFKIVCANKTGGTLRYVRFTAPPNANYGTLYYNYSPTGYSQPVSSTTDYRVDSGSTLLEKVTFVPAEGFVGTVAIPYRAFNSSNISYAGTLIIMVEYGEGGAGNVSFIVSPNGSVPLLAGSFQAACQSATGEMLSYIYFNALPSTAEGTLYYNYINSSRYGSLADTRSRYMVYGTPALSLVTFVPAAGFKGNSVTVPYRGYTTSGNSYTGNIIFRIGADSAQIRYSGTAGWPVMFDDLDFKEVCQANGLGALNTISYQLPNATMGVLYYDYGYSSTNRAVVGGVPYRVDTLDRTAFLPAAGFTGSVNIPFTGTDVNGRSFTGSVVVTVTGTGGQTVRYTTYSGGTVKFSAADFNAASQVINGEALDYVILDKLPSYNQGNIFYNYNTATNSGTSVNTSNKYYRTGGTLLLDNLTYKAPANFIGSMELNYTGVTVSGRSYYGLILISVTAPQAGTVSYTTRSLPITLRGSDFTNALNPVLPGLSYITFTSLPDSSQGQLLVNHSKPFTGTAVNKDTKYYVSNSSSGTVNISQISFLPRAEYMGTVTLYYTAVNSAGKTLASNKLTLTMGAQYGSNPYTDTGVHSWAEPSIEFLSVYEIVTGSGGGKFSPTASIKRCDFVLMLCRTFNFNPVYGYSFPDVPTNQYYATAVATAKDLGIVTGDEKGNFNPSRSITRQDAALMIQRAMAAGGKTTPVVSPLVLNLYNDSTMVSGYAQSAMASVVSMGLIQGDERDYLNPRNSMRRSEMAVVLHRLVTYKI